MNVPRLPGLTVTELFGAFMVAATLAALLLPPMAQARLQASRGICLTNMSRVAISASMYGMDYDGQLPIAPGQSGNGGGKAVLMKPLGVYQ